MQRKENLPNAFGREGQPFSGVAARTGDAKKRQHGRIRKGDFLFPCSSVFYRVFNVASVPELSNLGCLPGRAGISQRISDALLEGQHNQVPVLAQASRSKPFAFRRAFSIF
jgi:hypothetical protein